MAGGIGSRLWPVSTPQTPKQFMDILGVGKSLIQMTFERFLPLCPASNFWVVTSRKYAEIVQRQLPSVPEDQILLEPEARNTAPCIAYASWKIAKKYPDANIVVTPADALVLKTGEFVKVISDALEATASSSKIVTVGIAPTRPETGYGYIHSTSDEKGKVVKVSEFKEKPDLPTAKSYLENGSYFWNAGIFVWNVRTIVSQLRNHAPSIAAVMDRLEPSFYTEGEGEALARLFPECEKISIDYAVMEKSRDIYVIADDLGWSDLGSWGSVREHIAMDAEGNALVGKDVRVHSCRGCVVHAGDAKTVIVEGLEDYIVSVSDGNVLVCRLSKEQEIKEYSQNGRK